VLVGSGRDIHYRISYFRRGQTEISRILCERVLFLVCELGEQFASHFFTLTTNVYRSDLIKPHRYAARLLTQTSKK